MLISACYSSKMGLGGTAANASHVMSGLDHVKNTIWSLGFRVQGLGFTQAT